MPKLTTSQTITLTAAAVSLTCACGIGYHDTQPPPPPITALSVYPASLSFPATPLLTESQPLQFVVTNDYDRPLEFYVSESAADRKIFKIDAKLFYKRLDPQENFTILVTYTPSASGPAHGRILIHIANGSVIPVDLEGTSVPPPPTAVP